MFILEWLRDTSPFGLFIVLLAFGTGVLSAGTLVVGLVAHNRRMVLGLHALPLGGFTALFAVTVLVRLWAGSQIDQALMHVPPESMLEMQMYADVALAAPWKLMGFFGVFPAGLLLLSLVVALVKKPAPVTP